MKKVIRKRINVIIDRNAEHSDVEDWPSTDVREVGRLYTRLKSLSGRHKVYEVPLEDLPLIDEIDGRRIKFVLDGLEVKFV